MALNSEALVCKIAKDLKCIKDILWMVKWLQKHNLKVSHLTFKRSDSIESIEEKTKNYAEKMLYYIRILQ